MSKYNLSSLGVSRVRLAQLFQCLQELWWGLSPRYGTSCLMVQLLGTLGRVEHGGDSRHGLRNASSSINPRVGGGARFQPGQIRSRCCKIWVAERASSKAQGPRAARKWCSVGCGGWAIASPAIHTQPEPYLRTLAEPQEERRAGLMDKIRQPVARKGRQDLEGRWKIKGVVWQSLWRLHRRDPVKKRGRTVLYSEISCCSQEPPKQLRKEATPGGAGGA